MNKESELLQKAKAGDKEAMAELLLRYEPLIKKASRQKHLREIEDEAVSEAYLSFVTAVRKFDEAQGVPFAAFIKAMVTGSIYTFFKKHCRNGERERQVEGEAGELSFWDAISDERDEYSEFIESEAMKKALTVLDESEREVIESLYFKCRTQKETATLLGVTQQAVAKRKTKAFLKLKNYLVNFSG